MSESVKHTKDNPRHRRQDWLSREGLLSRDGSLRAARVGHSVDQIEVQKTDTLGDILRITFQGVYVIRQGRTHLVHRWGDEPGMYCPR